MGDREVRDGEAAVARVTSHATASSSGGVAAARLAAARLGIREHNKGRMVFTTSWSRNFCQNGHISSILDGEIDVGSRRLFGRNLGNLQP